ncbi:MFS transporter, partial [Aeromonas caviae]
AGLGGLFAALAGRPDLALATADELAFATRATFALTALLLMSALWLAGRGERAVQDDAARDGCESGEC